MRDSQYTRYAIYAILIPCSHSPPQDALIKRLGDGALPFSVDINPQAPPSVQLVPAKRYYGAPIGTSYDVRCFVGQYSVYHPHSARQCP